MKNAYIGYSYQQRVTSLLLAKMDVERELDVIEIEADVTNDFDDLKIQTKAGEFYFQIKDIDNLSLNALQIVDNTILINGKSHSLSESTNVIFFKHIDASPTTEILGIPACKFGDVFIISLSRENIDNRVSNLYRLNHERESIINSFFSACLDHRRFRIERKDLPSIPVFDTKLVEPTIDVGRKHLDIENIIVLEGKPGIGKSHLVNCLVKEYKNHFLYRFWISSQDKEYNQRLKFPNFLFDFSKKLFKDQVPRTEGMVLEKLWDLQATVIIDGLDHVENYNPNELNSFIDFIQRLQTKTKTIVLTRPLQKRLLWSTHKLTNWNDAQTRKVLSDLFHISDYSTATKIYAITDGYPILVKYLAEHYKMHSSLPNLGSLSGIDEYYGALFDHNVKTKSALTIFLCCRSFYTRDEINLFLGEAGVIVNEFINDYPYLFECRLNRVSLLHDSFNTYLRKQNIDYSHKLKSVNKIVLKSVMDLKHQFLCRLEFFDLGRQSQKKIAIKYASISVFANLVKGVIDFEAIQSFYSQLREWIADMAPDDLTIENYYDFSLIINLVNRDHVSTLNQFLFTYIKVLLANGYTDNNITSSGYLFGMLHYTKTGNSDLLFNLTSNDYYDTSRFAEDLQEEITKEQVFFNRHSVPLSKSKIQKLLVKDTEFNLRDKVTYALENLFLYEKNQADFPDFTKCIKTYIQSNDEEAIEFLEVFLEQQNVQTFYARWILDDAKKNLLALGHLGNANDYLTLRLSDFLTKYRQLGSFKMWTEILNYLRLSLHNNNSVDIESIAPFWTKYYQRKDYSLISIPTALHVFERWEFVKKEESIRLIAEVQEVSEKGYRGLLADYIELQSPLIISFLTNSFDEQTLRVPWLTLSPKYINQIPDRIFNNSMNEHLRYHRSNREIDSSEVFNVVKSNRCSDLRDILNWTKFKLRVPMGSKDIVTLRKAEIPFVEYANDNDKYRQSSEQRLTSGILTAKDKKLIVKHKLTPEDVAGLADGYYSTLADIDLYKVFPSDKIRKCLKPILHKALVSKAGSVDSFHSLFYFPGNIPKLVSDYDASADKKQLFKSFKRYLELSMFDVYPA
jgi:hypothetical protein